MPFDLANFSNKPLPYLLLPFLFTFLFTVIFLPIYINWLKHLQIGQFIREEGPASHASKAKTPTMGGILFVAAVVSSSILFSILSGRWNITAISVVAVGLLCALLGLIDDMSKFMNKANKGLSASRRLLLEMIFGAGFGLVLVYIHPQAKELLISMSSFVIQTGNVTGHLATLPTLAFIILCIFVIAASANSVNLNDGMDGLAAGVALPIFLCLAIILMETNNLSLALISVSCAGSLTAFLLFNCYPAKIFMGDVGSLFIGGLLGAIVLASGLTIWFIPLSLLYILEALSVILQVSYFKLTKPYTPPSPINSLNMALYKLTHKLPGEGKRIFRMSPLHHHFELVLGEKGITEWQVVMAFWFVQLLIFCAVLAAFSHI